MTPQEAKIKAQVQRAALRVICPAATQEIEALSPDELESAMKYAADAIGIWFESQGEVEL